MSSNEIDPAEKEKRAKKALIIYTRNKWSGQFCSQFPDETLGAIQQVMDLLEENYRLVPDDIFVGAGPADVKRKIEKIREKQEKKRQA